MAELSADIERLFREGTRIDAALTRAAQEAVRSHQQNGDPMPIWRDGGVVWIRPAELPVQPTA